MSELKPVTTHYKAEHARMLREVGHFLAGNEERSTFADRLQVALYLVNQADKIEDVFQQLSNVVQFPRDGAA